MNAPRFFLSRLALAGIGILVGTGALAQQRKSSLRSQVVSRGPSLMSFVPRGWKLEKSVRGDLNRDKKPDAALILVEHKTSAEPRRRALVVALRGRGVWRRAGFSDVLLLGTRDGGAFYGGVETPVEIEIQKGVLHLAQESGSREVLETTHKFRFDARRRVFFLIGLDSTARDRVTGRVRAVSANFLTGVQTIEEFMVGRERVSRKTQRVRRKLRTLEQITGDERYSN